MANVLVNDASLSAIADAIRGKNGSSDTYTPGEMASAITEIPTGSGGLRTTTLGGPKATLSTLFSAANKQLIAAAATPHTEFGWAGQIPALFYATGTIPNAASISTVFPCLVRYADGVLSVFGGAYGYPQSGIFEVTSDDLTVDGCTVTNFSLIQESTVIDLTANAQAMLSDCILCIVY